MNTNIEHNPVRIMEIIIHVISEMRDSKNVEEIDLQPLRVNGYSDEEISIAISWLAQGLEQITTNTRYPNELQKTQSFRILHPAERHLFSKEALGELTQLQSLGIISSFQIESIIERSFMYGALGISRNDLYTIVTDIVFKENMFQPGSRVVINNSGTVH